MLIHPMKRLSHMAWIAVVANVILAWPGLAEQSTEALPVSITVDAAKPLGPLKPIWRMFGADEPNYAYMRDGSKLIHELGALRPNDVYFRAHNLLCSGDGTPALKWGSSGVYREDASGNPIYDWTILDRIFDTYRDAGVRPYAQIGFMPEALSTHPEPYQHHWKPGDHYSEIETGWAYPPKDYDKWRELVRQWVAHCVERYGKSEVEKWYWEVWNEANGAYWRAKPQEFWKLHDYAVDGIRRALPTARVGGPEVAGSGGRWTREFLEHCLRGTNFATGQVGTPLDFVSFHAKGAPTFTNGHVRMGIANQVRTVEAGFRLINSYPELKNIPIVIGESDPDGCAACQGEQLGYRNTTMYSSYEAAIFSREWELARRDGVNLDAALTWAFTFEGQAPFAGFRQLAGDGIDLPVLNVFRLFSQMGGEQLAVSSDAEIPLADMEQSGVRAKPDVSAIACLRSNKLCVFAWHYHDDDVPGPDAAVNLTISDLPADFVQAHLTRYAIDKDHDNAFTVWKKMGSPQEPSEAQRAQLEQAGKLSPVVMPLPEIMIASGALHFGLRLPRQAVTLLEFDFSGPGNVDLRQ